MGLWFVFAVLTALATLAVLWPLARARKSAPSADAHDLAVYRDQLEELDRDRERGLIGRSEAEAARTEIARRALRAADGASGEIRTRTSLARPIAVAAALGVPLAAVGIYLMIGSPDLPGQPLMARLDAVGDDNIEAMVARVERHLATSPDDVEGWRVLAPIYARSGRFDDAVTAWRRVIKLDGATPEAQENLGEVLVASSDGLVTPEAEQAFAAALAEDPTRIKARFYRALGHAQAGRLDAALADYDEILRTSPPDAPWLEAVNRDREAVLAEAGKTAAPAAGAPGAPGPDAAAVAAASEMSADDRSAMIDSMVTRLAERLKDDPNDADGWQRLIRAYGVLGRTDDARAAFQTASATFADAPEMLAAIRQVALEAGVSVQ